MGVGVGTVPDNTQWLNVTEKTTPRNEGLRTVIRGNTFSYCRGEEGHIDFHRQICSR